MNWLASAAGGGPKRPGFRAAARLQMAAVLVIGALIGSALVFSPAAAAAAQPTNANLAKLLIGAAVLLAAPWVVTLVVRRRATALTVITVVLLGLPYGRATPSFVVYEDQYANTTAITLLSVMLLVTFMTAQFEKRADTAQPARVEPVLALLGIIALAGLLTQTLHIGLLSAAGVAYVRVVQPIMFVWLIARMVRREGSLLPAVLALTAAAAAGLTSRLLLTAAGAQGLVNVGGRISAIGSWTIYGTILAATVMLLIGLAIHSKSVSVSLLYVLGIPLVIAELFATQTRGAILGLVAAFAFILARKQRFTVAAVTATAATVLFVLGIGLQLPGNRALTLNASQLASESSTYLRLARNVKAIGYIVENPLTGLGLGQPSNAGESDISVWVYNPYLAWGVAFGLPALLAFAGVMYVTTRGAVLGVRRSHGREQYLRIAVLASLGVWIINQFSTGDSLTYLQSMDSVLFFYAIVGMVLGSQWVDREAFASGQEDSVRGQSAIGHQDSTAIGETALYTRTRRILEGPGDAWR